MTSPLRLLTASLVAAALLLGGCSTGQGSSVPTAALKTVPTADVDASHNATDVAFAQSMLAMHQQEAELAQIALERSGDRGVRALASETVDAVAVDDRLVALLTAWGAALPGGMEGAPDVDPSASPAAGVDTGLLGADQVADLTRADGEEFDRMLLDLLAEQHQGGIDLALTELNEGSNPQALELAALLRDDHAAALERIEGLRSDR